MKRKRFEEFFVSMLILPALNMISGNSYYLLLLTILRFLFLDIYALADWT